MGRKAGVWYWTARKCWACTVDGKRVTERSGIAEDDVIHAHLWWRAIRGRDTAVPYGTHTVEDLCEEYLTWDLARVSEGKRDERGYDVYKSRLKAICRTVLAVGPLKDVRATEANHEVIDEVTAIWSAKGLSPGYRRNLAAALLTVFRWSSKPRRGQAAILEINPTHGYKLPPVPPADEKFAERNEAAAWLRWLWRSGVHRDFVLLQRCLIHTGARPSEWCGGTVGEIIWSARPTPQLVRKKWKNSRKSGKPRRVYLPIRITRAIRRHIHDKTADSPIFINSRGNPWNAASLSALTQALRTRAVEAKVPIAETGANRLTCYRWRHTAASNLLMAGVDIATVAKLLGTSVEHIAKTYGHIQDDHLAVAAQRMTRPK